MKPTRGQIPRTPGRKTPSRNNSREKLIIRDPVEVFCRLRPVPVDVDGCIKVPDENTVQIATPDRSLGHRGATYKEYQYTFSRVFNEEASQKEVFKRVSYSLVEGLLKGKNGLLFTYGVTGSGKTFTMTGTPKDPGILPRCLDVLFNSISELQARKFTFKPDKLNGFDIQSELEANRDIHDELVINLTGKRVEFPKTPRRRMADWENCDRAMELATVPIPDPDVVFSVFITYIEIYNNCVYDLLDEPADDIARMKPPQPRLVREDAQGNMYAHGVVEIEVKSAQEAFQVFQRGLRRKTMAHTVLNAESSRSHAIFTLRLVQAPLDKNGEDVIINKHAVTISQLSLVDLAGSERTNRSKTEGARLREAGNINNSLLTLRKCFEILRENQSNAGNGAPKMVPYRDSRLTHLFKNYFDGEGQVRMIVCVNPNPGDYDETLHVMKFAEMTREVQVARPTPKQVDLGLGYTPGRRRGNQLFREAARRLEAEGIEGAASLPVDLGVVYSLGIPIPQCNINSPECEELLKQLMLVLEKRIESRRSLERTFNEKSDSVRAAICALERDCSNMKQENSCLRATLESDKAGRKALEDRLIEAEAQLVSAKLQIQSLTTEKHQLQTENERLLHKISRSQADVARTKQRAEEKLQEEKERTYTNMKTRWAEKTTELKHEADKNAEKLRKVQKIIESENEKPSSSDSNYVRGRVNRINQAASTSNLSKYPLTPNPTRRGIAVSNPRHHRRSRSAGGGERWLDHRPETTVCKLLDLNTVLQPKMGRRKSINKLTNVRDVTDNTSKYCLTTQEQDSAGELETKLYKGDVLPTTCGGAQVVLNDVEILRQTSPTDPRLSPQRKRSAENLNREVVADRCKIGIEGHNKRARK